MLLILWGLRFMAEFPVMRMQLWRLLSRMRLYMIQMRNAAIMERAMDMEKDIPAAVMDMTKDIPAAATAVEAVIIADKCDQDHN